MLNATLDSHDETAAVAVRIDVSSVVVRLALSYVSDDHGWRSCRGGHDRCNCVIVSDRAPTEATPIDVLVVRDTPSECQDALSAVLHGTARAVVLWDEPMSLATAVGALERHDVTIPQRVIDLAQHAPQLNPRQRRTLTLVGAGRTNAEISSALHQSASTTKRDIAELMALFDAVNRAGLTTAAGRLGFL